MKVIKTDLLNISLVIDVWY